VGLRPAGQVAARLATLVVALLFSFPALASADAGGSELVGYVNAMRAANGIPAGITENPAASLGCLMHNRYGILNDVLTHHEDATAPGFTDAGAAAGARAVLYRGMQWSAADSPFEHAPLHLHQLLSPRLDTMGASETGGFGCATVASHNRRAPRRNVTYTYPANGATDWREGEIADELPFTPGEFVGIAPDTPTGPYLYVLFDGPGIAPTDIAKVARANLVGPVGPVPIAIVDNTTRGLQGYLPVGAELIPRGQLAPGTTYTAKVVATVGATRFKHKWSFRTAGGEPLASASSVPAATATAARSAETASPAGVWAVRQGNNIALRLTCPRACLVRGIGRLSAGGDSRHLPYARAGRLTEGPIDLRFALSHSARRWLHRHPFMRLRLSVSGLFVQSLTATLRYARTSGSSSANLPLASSVPSSG
jgi:hypothetical protein